MHTIRLRGPWEVEPVERFVLQADGMHRSDRADLPRAVRAKMPADWAETLGARFLGRVRYRRTFQKPTGLESGEQVWLVVELPRSHGVVELNGKLVGEVALREPPGRFVVTEILEEHNRLEIMVEHPSLDVDGASKHDGDTNLVGGLVGEVRLEIEE